MQQSKAIAVSPGYTLESPEELWKNTDAWASPQATEIENPRVELSGGIFFLTSLQVSRIHLKLGASGLKCIQAHPRSVRNSPGNH